jgi:hypothetical protein
MMSLADHCEIILRALLDAGPLSMDDLHARTALDYGPINAALTSLHLGGRVAPEVVRVQGRKVTRYDLKRRYS